MSNLIKSQFYVTVDDTKFIDSMQIIADKSQAVAPASALSDEEALQLEQELDAARGMKNSILKDAEEMAEALVSRAMEEAGQLREQAETEIAGWWEESRRMDEEAAAAAREQGWNEGYKEGHQQAEIAVREQYSEMIAEASNVMDQAYTWKRRIIDEAEPFLIELSTAIAEKIIQRQLSLEPDWMLGLTRSVLSRKRDKGIITLCVAPRHFSFFQDARDELLLAIDSQAELQIVPDSTVEDEGCVLRSDFGSVDARIDTQLTEIKEALKHMASRPENGAEDEQSA